MIVVGRSVDSPIPPDVTPFARLWVEATEAHRWAAELVSEDTACRHWGRTLHMTTRCELTAEAPAIGAPRAGAGQSDERPGATTRTFAATRAVLVASIVASVTWIGAVAVSAFIGFDTTDEGFYLLSYRWWSENRQTFTGAQYVYGPIFEALGYDIVRLRLFSLITVVATYVAFGWSFMRWLRVRRPDADPSRLWEWAGTTTIVASGGLAYSWLPLTPVYNQISLLTAMLATAVVLRASVLPKSWVPLLLGPVIVAGMLAKWGSSALTFVAIAAVAIYLLRRAAVRFFLLALLSTVATLLLVQLFVIPLTDAIPQADHGQPPGRSRAQRARRAARLVRENGILRAVCVDPRLRRAVDRRVRDESRQAKTREDRGGRIELLGIGARSPGTHRQPRPAGRHRSYRAIPNRTDRNGCCRAHRRQISGPRCDRTFARTADPASSGHR